MVFLGGERKSGIDTVLDLIGFDKRLEGTDLVVTVEGRTDWQSCFGKVMQGVGERGADASLHQGGDGAEEVRIPSGSLD